MLQHTQQGDELLELATVSEAHLREAGHAVKMDPNEDTTAFDIVPDDGGEMVCRVQAVGRETWEIARPGGETLTGLGDRRAYLAMLENVVASQLQRAA
ncbi:MAG: hypothetical protein AAF409_09580 [Pseudomonadota bacterium]